VVSSIDSFQCQTLIKVLLHIHWQRQSQQMAFIGEPQFFVFNVRPNIRARESNRIQVEQGLEDECFCIIPANRDHPFLIAVDS
jgi:hypothetical protein